MALGLVDGALEGWLASKKTAGKDAGNAFNLSSQDMEQAQGQLSNLLGYQANQNVVDPLQGSRTAASEVQNNALLSDVFGKGGTMSRAVKEEQDLAGRGYSLKGEDHEAYGQAQDNIARQFGMQEGNLAQALSSRGLSGSNIANQAFSGMQGNKMEQLAGMQRKIADDRMKSNMERLGQTRNFMQGLSSQAGNELNAQNSRQMGAEEAKFNQLESKNNAAMQRLDAMQQQGNENLAQRQATAESPAWAGAGLGAIQGANNGAILVANVLTGGKAGGQMSPPPQQKKPGVV